MNDREKQALQDIVEDLLDLAEEEQSPCDFCYKLVRNNRKLMYNGRETKYCPFCGRKFISAETP